MAPGVRRFIPNIMKISPLVQKLKGRDRQTTDGWTNTQGSMVISQAYFSP